ncbi:hypothetical protein HanXRQr2_Chr08g0322161 [Helianthus annuus]|uniref:Uncharacterized protein n=1 Tax=Helianthus annuus TaxID=4232 RepID=A0A9K3IBW3_HELAN|nr:hypothetical protein HanXRQr2_Chr08g0322161 [Helianthus annuus]KAJ0900282.1 hypothetical protein HanPSC8_Chr08g0312101 [Helianthus annuus]
MPKFKRRASHLTCAWIHLRTNGFWQTSILWSLPFSRSMTLASHRICVATARAFSMDPTSSERTTHPCKRTKL